MATTKNIKLKNAAGSVILYPQTTVGQVINLDTTLSGKQNVLTAGSGIALDADTIAAELTYEEELDTPVVTTATPGTLEVTEVSGATSYKIYAGSTEIGEVTA